MGSTEVGRSTGSLAALGECSGVVIATMAPCGARPTGDWVGVTTDPLPLVAAAGWTVVPQCGAISLFGGTVRGFSSVVDCSRLWVNGEPAARGDAVGTGDEVAVLSPVSES